MWESILDVTTPLTLVALIIIAVYSSYRAKVKKDLKVIRELKPSDRVKALEETEARYEIDTSGLTKDQKFAIIMRQLEDKSKQRTSLLYFFSFIAILLAMLSAFSFFKIQNIDSNISPEPEDSVRLVHDTLFFKVTDGIKPLAGVVVESENLSARDTSNQAGDVRLWFSKGNSTQSALLNFRSKKFSISKDTIIDLAVFPREIALKRNPPPPPVIRTTDVILQTRTGTGRNHGTDDHVSVRLVGSKSSTPVVLLDNPGNDRAVERPIDVYPITQNFDIGILREVQFFLRKRRPAGEFDDWRIREVIVKDLNRRVIYRKELNEWVGEGSAVDGMIVIDGFESEKY